MNKFRLSRAGLRVPLILGLTTLAAATVLGFQRQLGYDDTPLLPGTSWRVHDGRRPQPKVVAPGETFSHGAQPPSDATVLFDGSDLSQWESGRGRAVSWPVANGYFEIVPGTGLIKTRERFADFQFHLEFVMPRGTGGDGQGSGNSGVMINGMYEVQLLNSFQSQTYPDGQCGAIYGQTPPLVNACRPPGTWQTYDIVFESPRWDEAGQLVQKAYVTVIHNGVLLHHRRELMGCTDGIGGVPHKSLSKYPPPHSPEVTIELQDHGHPLRFRNIWIREIGDYDQT